MTDEDMTRALALAKGLADMLEATAGPVTAGPQAALICRALIACHEQTEDLRKWIRAANKFAWAHERNCPRHDADAPCTCGLDQFMSQPRVVVESYEAQIAGDQHALAVIERLCGDDYCEDLEMRKNLAPDLAEALERLLAIYAASHSAVRSHSCYHVHTDWRDKVARSKSSRDLS